MIVIDKFGNLIIRVSESAQQYEFKQDWEHMGTNFDDTSTRVHRVEEFKVCRSTLMEYSPVFKALLSPQRFAEGEQNIVTLKEDHIMSMEILFRVLHDASLQSILKTPIEEMWPLVVAAEKYDLDIKIFQEWFKKWYQSATLDLSTVSVAAMLLYPCWIFSHATAFAYATQVLAYGSVGHIMEINPTKHYELHLPARVIQQINAAKGRLRTILHTDLFRPNARLLSAKCECKEKTLFGYEKSLYDLKVWPLEQVGQKYSVGDILCRLEGFSYDAPTWACCVCRADYGTFVANTLNHVGTYFDGLCLDCMDRSKSRSGDTDEDYWQHNNLSETDVIENCRFEHKQPTWYFSFMGRKEDRERFREHRRPYKGAEFGGGVGTFPSGELPHRQR